MKKVLFPILVLLILTAGCTYSPGGFVCAPQLPSVTKFDASPSPVNPGESATLNWIVTGATSVTIDQGIGTVALTGSRTVAPTATTTYTLIATGAGGTATATAQVIVSGTPIPTPTPTPTPSPTPSPGLPVVNYFFANPPSIISGGTSTLSWSVSNATSVAIDQGIGSVGLVGTAPASPASTTSYTLTANNAYGWYSQTITLVVGAAPPLAKPDLIVTDIARSGDTVTYTIKNQGTATAGASTSALVIDGVVKAYDSVGPLNAGASSTESFATYTYSCSGSSDTLVVQADKDNVVDEGGMEGNNGYSESWTCILFVPPLLELKKPDLVVEDIWRSGGTFYYRIKNQGTLASAASTSQLYIDGILRASDSVPSLAAGASSNQSFPSFMWLCVSGSTHSAEVRADTGNTNSEFNEGNNTYTEPFVCGGP